MPVYREPTRVPTRNRSRKRRKVKPSAALTRTPTTRTPRRTIRRTARRRAIRSRAVDLSIPTEQFGMRVPTGILRPQVRAGTRVQERLQDLAIANVDRKSALDFAGEAEEDIRPYAEAASLLLPGGGAALRIPGVAARVAGAGRVAGEVAGVAGRRVLGARAAAGEAAQAVRASRVAQTAGRAARSKPARIAGGTAKVAGKTAAFPVRHPLKTTKYSVYAQAPVALQSGDPSKLADPFVGEGVVADVLKPVSETLGALPPGEFLENLGKDIIDLPANTPPALYMPLAGAKEAIFNDDPSRLEGLVEDYTEHGLIPNLVSGDFAGAAEAAKEHPLFAALEARGAQAVIGRGTGIAARSGALGPRMKQAGSKERKDLRVRGTEMFKERSYSGDIIEKAVQITLDKRRAKKQGGQFATPRQARNIENEFMDTLVTGFEGLRRANRAEEGAGGKLTGKGQTAAARAVGIGLVMMKVAKTPETMVGDLTKYASKLDRQATRLRQRINKAPDRESKFQARRQLTSNKIMRKGIEKLLKDPDTDPEAIFASAAENARVLREKDKTLEELEVLGEGQGPMAAAIPFAVTHMGAKRGVPKAAQEATAGAEAKVQRAAAQVEAERAAGTLSEAALRRLEVAEAQRADSRKASGQPQMIDRGGKPLTLNQIHAEMRRQGVNPAEVGFLSQRSTARGPGSFFRSMWPKRQTIPAHARSGKATRRGAFDATLDAIIEQRIRSQGIIDAVKGFDSVVREATRGQKRFDKWSDALDHAAFLEASTGTKFVPVREHVFSGRSREGQEGDQIFEALDPEDQLGRQNVSRDQARLAFTEGPAPKAGITLMPATSAKRLAGHFADVGTTRRAMQLISSTFKGTVLPTSPNWFLGNLVDVTMRSLMTGTTPWGRDAALGRRLLKELDKLDPEVAKRVRAELAPGTVHGQAANTRVHRDSRQFVETKLAPFAAAFGAVRRTPGPKQVVDLYKRYRDGAFALNEWGLERQAQHAQIGKMARREIREKTNSWHKALKLGDDAVADLANGLLKTEKQIKYAKAVEETLGRWARHSPEMRAFLVDYMPFGTWARNATTFAFLTLPLKHPIKVALATAAFEMTEEEREKMGLSHFAPPGTRLPGNLQGSIPVGEGGMLTPQSLSTFGFASDLQTNLSSMILPQFPLQELAGLDFTGEKLVDSEGRPLDEFEQAKVALLATAESYIPFLSMGNRISENGLVEGAVPRSVRPYDAQLVGFLQSLSGKQDIQVPVRGSEFAESYQSPSSSSGGGSSSGSSLPPSNITPWRGSSTSDSTSSSSSGSTSSGTPTPWR